MHSCYNHLPIKIGLINWRLFMKEYIIKMTEEEYKESLRRITEMVLIDFELMENDSTEPGDAYADCFTWAVPVIHKLINKDADCD